MYLRCIRGVSGVYLYGEDEDADDDEDEDEDEYSDCDDIDEHVCHGV